MNIKTETVYRRAAMLSELDEQYRLDFVKCLQPGDVVGVYDVFFGNIYYPDFSGNDVVKKTTPSGIIKLENSEFTFDRFGCGRGKAKIGIGRRGKMIGLPK